MSILVWAKPRVESSLLAAAALMLLVAPVRAAGPSSISGCWTQTSPFPYAQAPPGKEWGSRTWCFKPHGKMTRVHVACDRAGCDGWDLDGHYRWRQPVVWISDVDMSDDGKRQTKVWRRCRVGFPAKDRMVLEDCYFSPDPWVREPTVHGVVFAVLVPAAVLRPNARRLHIRVQKNSIFIRSAG